MRWRDPLSGRCYPGEPSLLSAVARDHAPQLAAWGVTPAQLLYNARNRLPLGTRSGRSVMSGKPTAWCERAGRYERFHDEHERSLYRQSFLDRMHRVHGKDHLLDDPEHQRAMLAQRSISGKYTFQDGSVKTYTGKEEEALLEFLDHGLSWPGSDVQCPAPQNFPYVGPDGKSHIFIPDCYIESLNLIIEVKGEMHNGWRNRDREIERTKDEVLGTSGYEYCKVEDKDYGELIDAIARIKALAEDWTDTGAAGLFG
jgi:hypothetical protein